MSEAICTQSHPDPTAPRAHRWSAGWDGWGVIVGVSVCEWCVIRCRTEHMTLPIRKGVVVGPIARAPPVSAPDTTDPLFTWMLTVSATESYQPTTRYHVFNATVPRLVALMV